MSEELKEIRKEKRHIKKALKRSETDQPLLLQRYKIIQEKIRNQVLTEKTKKTNTQLNKMIQDKSRVNFWKERKKLMRNQANECGTVKNESGERQYDPEKIKETNAKFFEKLYSKKPVRSHPHHKTVEEEILEFEKDKDQELGSILEEVIDKRLEKIVTFSQGQAGGVRGASTS